MVKKSIKKRGPRQIQRQLQQRRGRPAKIQEIDLNPSNFWANAHGFKPLKLLRFLHDIGRHSSPHLTGQLGSNANAKTEKLNLNKQKQKYYDCAEQISHEYFDHQNIDKRCFPFFFRIPGSPKFNGPIQVYGEKGAILSYVLDQLNHKFIVELIDILNSELSDEELAIKFLKHEEQPLISIETMKGFSEIVQNAYIKFILDDMIANHRDYSQQNQAIQASFQQYISSEIAFVTIANQIRSIREIMCYQYQPQMLPYYDQYDLVQFG